MPRRERVLAAIRLPVVIALLTSGILPAASQTVAPPPAVPIPALQGTGPASPFSGERVTTEGIVTAVLPGLRGFALQDEHGDGDPRSSDGIFVYAGRDAVTVQAGERVRLTGVVREYLPRGATMTLTEIAEPEVNARLGWGTVDPLDVDAAELVAGLKAQHDFAISVAAYPEVHPEAVSAAADLDNLKRKLDAGASQAITQFFYSTDAYFRFLDKALAAGITAPIVPGIMPVTSFEAIRRMSGNTEIPAWLEQAFEGLEERPGPRALVAATVAVDLCHRLYRGGVRHFHFYTLNRAEQAYAICQLLGVRPK